MRRVVWLVLLLLSWASPALAALTFATIGTPGRADTDGPYTINASFADVSGAFYLIAFDAFGTGLTTSDNPTIGGTHSGVTWTCPASARRQFTGDWVMYVCYGTGTVSTGSLTIDLAVTTDSAGYGLFSVTGAHATPTNSNMAAAGGTSITPSVTLSAYGHANNRGFGFVRHGAGPFSGGTNWTELVEWNGAFDTGGVAGYDSDTTVSTGASASDSWGMIAIEVRDAADGGAAATPPRLLLLGVGGES